MMVVVFYDRRNNREVKSDQLVPIELVRYYALFDETPHRVVEAELGYKSPSCPVGKNWDMETTLVDLVFLRLE